MSETPQLCLIIPGRWIGHFIGRGGCFAANIRRTYRVGYNIVTTDDDQGHKIGKIYINGRNFAVAKAALCSEASRLNEIEYTRANSEYDKVPYSPVSTDETSQRVPSASAFPPLPTVTTTPTVTAAEHSPKVIPKEDVSHKIQIIQQLRAVVNTTYVIKQLRAALATEQTKNKRLVAEKSIICSLLHKERKMTSTTLIIRGIPKVRLTGDTLGIKDLHTTLAKAGDITYIHLTNANGSMDEQVCYVTLAERRTAVELKKILNGNKIEGSVMRVSFFVTRWDNTSCDSDFLSPH